MIASLAAATLLPLSSNGQKKSQIATQTNKELSETITKREIIDYNGKKILIKESHEEVIKMTVKNMQEKYKENFESIFMTHMLAEINKRRELLWLEPLVRDVFLITICKDFSKHLAEQQERWHKTSKQKTWFDNPWIKKYKLLRENVTFDNWSATIFDVVDNREFLDDKRDAMRWEKREKSKNHKYAIIGDDIEYFWWSIATDKNGEIYIVIKSGAKF